MVNKILVIIMLVLGLGLFQTTGQHKIEEITPKEYDEFMDEGYGHLEVFSPKDHYLTDEKIIEVFMASNDVTQNHKDDFINGRLTFTVIVFVQINYGVSYWIQTD